MALDISGNSLGEKKKKELKFYWTLQIGGSRDLSKGSFSGLVTTKGLVPRWPFFIFSNVLIPQPTSRPPGDQ